MQGETFRQKDWEKDRILNLVLDGTKTLGEAGETKDRKDDSTFLFASSFFF